MSSTTNCDKCHKEIEKNKKEGSGSLSLNINGLDQSLPNSEKRWETFDFCPECTKEIFVKVISLLK